VARIVEDRRVKDDRHFDDWARRYDRSMAQSLFFDPVQRSVVRIIGPRIPLSGAVLDVGCGTGRLLNRLSIARPDAKLVGLDRSLGMVEAMRRLRPQLAVARGTAEALPHGDGVFDVVLTTVSFHHWEKAPSLAEVHRVLQPGGTLALTDVSVDDLPSRPSWLWAHLRRNVSDMPTLDERAGMLEAAGFRVVEHVATLHRHWIPLTVAERNF
jgi:ubiquinone/menaquinone biosynthesis C-methylase UbiE